MADRSDRDRSELRDRARGCLLGGAVGDALGAPVEFTSSDAIRTRFGAGGVTTYVPAYGRTGAVTDDTQMALFTAEGLIRASNRGADRGLVDVPEVMNRAYQRWLLTQVGDPASVPWDPGFPSGRSGWLVDQEFLHSARAPGNTCLDALRSGVLGTPAAPVNDSKGCGGVMRAAPAGFLARDPFRTGVELAAITHGHPSGYLAAGALAMMIAELVAGRGLPGAVEVALARTAREPGSAEVVDSIEAAVALAAGGRPGASKVTSLGEGWIAEEALSIGVYCALVADDFASGVALAVSHGGDSDSTGSIFGNLAGARRGEATIPDELLDGLEGRDVIEQVADDLADAAVGRPPDHERYPPW